MTIFVGSTNPVKINAVIQAASETYPDVKVEGFSVSSGVAEQPWTDDEAQIGAENRAIAALQDGLNKYKSVKGEVLGLGLEGGVFENELGELWSTVWAVVVNRDGEIWECNGARVKVPDIVAKHMRAGEEMGPVMQQLTGIDDVRSQQGMFGIITKNFIDRTEEYAAIAKMALGIWYGRDWDKDLKS